MKNNIKILMIASEVTPLAKVGGLGDVIGSLPTALNKAGLDVRIIIPFYQSIDRDKYKIEKIHNDLEISFITKESVNVWQTTLPNSNVIVYLIENDKYFSNDIYHGDNKEKFVFFSFSCLIALQKINFIPDIIHCHDYQSAIIPRLIKESSHFENLRNIKTILTIHNLAYQGSIANRLLDNLGIKTDKMGDSNLLQQGILSADAFTTVSPTYAREIKTPDYGENLEDVINANAHKLHGIINGIDYDFFNPANDKLIVKNFSADNLSGKIFNKKNIQEKFNLPIDDSIPVVGMISRIVEQKGFDLLVDRFGQLPCQFVILGTGNKTCEDVILSLIKKFPTKFAANFSFDEKLAHQIYAGCDIFAMPSRFEPCGLGQMIAMRYGALPVVHKIGGLTDTVNEKNGFIFDEYSSNAFYQTLEEALLTYANNQDKWLELQKNCLNTDFSWLNSAKKYKNLYLNTIK